MGSLVGAAMIGGAGKGLQRTAESMRETRMQDDDQAHQLQVQRQRDKAARIAATTRSTHEIGMADAQYRRDIGMADSKNKLDLAAADLFNERELAAASLRYGQDVSLLETDIDFKAWKVNADNESDEFQTMFGKFLQASSGAAGTSGSAGDWKVDYVQELTPDGLVTTMKSSHPSGITMEQVGDKMLYVGNPELRDEGLAPFDDPNLQAQVEKTLWDELAKGNDTGQRFLKQYKYLPHWYMVKKFEADNTNQLGQFWEYFNRNRGLPGMSMEGRALPMGVREKQEGRATTYGTAEGESVTPVTQEEEAAALQGGENLKPTAAPIERKPFVRPELLDIPNMQTIPGGAIYRGAAATKEFVGEGVDVAAGLGSKGLEGINVAGRAVSDLFRGPQRVEVPEETEQ